MVMLIYFAPVSVICIYMHIYIYIHTQGDGIYVGFVARLGSK